MMTPPLGESAISKVESGERRLSNLQLADLANILQCRPEEIPVLPGRDRNPGIYWEKAQQEVVENSIASGAAATGYVLAQLRKRHGRTMQQVANAIGMTLSVYHRVEMASRMVQSHEIDAVAKFYDMNSAQLIELFDRRAKENLQQLRDGVPPEQLLPRAPRALLKDDARWGGLGTLERYALRRSIRRVEEKSGTLSLPVYGAMKKGPDGGRQFTIDRNAAVEHTTIADLTRADEECFLVHNYSQRLGFMMRPGSLALVDPRLPVALGDLAFVIRKDGSADAGVIIADGLGPMMVKMYNPEEELPVESEQVAEVFRISMLILA